MIIAAFHKSGSEILLAACDADIHGKRLEEGDIIIDLGSAFFDGNEVSGKEFLGMLAQATSGNLVGRKVVDLAIKAECIHPDAAVEICGVPHAMFFCMG
jgi:hypothetical protein